MMGAPIQNVREAESADYRTSLVDQQARLTIPFEKANTYENHCPFPS